VASTRELALVTGASSGIGLALARRFAAENMDVVITAEDDQLTTVASELRALGTDVLLVQADLRTSAGVDHLWSQIVTHGRPLDVAALNAGIGVGGGTFLETDLDAHLDVIRLNVLGNVHLAKLVLSDMVTRGKGRVLITSSLVAAMPGPYQTTYNASKSFLQSFAQGLQTELRGSPVTVTALMPGAIQTPFFARAGMSSTLLGRAKKGNPDTVARQAYEALRHGDRRVVGGGVLSKAGAWLNTVLPDAAKARMQEILSKPRPSRPRPDGQTDRTVSIDDPE
jgi:short-subunit dehydrogenase